jgi:membrane-bound metal-dependent hydrolase YbcI (DUF457 family)
MCTPIGHGLAAWALTAKGSRSMRLRPIFWLPAMWALSVLPDFDFIPGLLKGHPNIYHHGWTHSIVFCFVMAGLAAAVLALAKAENAVKLGGLVFLALISHIVLDCFSRDQAPPYGLQVLWPFSRKYFLSPFTPFLDVNKGIDNGTFLLRLFTLHNVKTVFVEILILGPIPLWVWLRNKRKIGEDRA